MPRPGIQSTPDQIWSAGSVKLDLSMFAFESTSFLWEPGQRMNVLYVRYDPWTLNVARSLILWTSYYQKVLGAWNLLEADSGFEAGAMAILTRNEGWGRDEVKILAQKARNDIRNHNIHSMFDLWVISSKERTPFDTRLTWVQLRRLWEKARMNSLHDTVSQTAGMSAREDSNLR